MAGFEAGKAVALAGQQRWPSTPVKALLLSFPEGGPLFLEREAAAKRGIAEVMPSLMPEVQSTKNDPNVGRQAMTDFLTRNPGQKIIVYSHIDSVSIAALAAAKAAGREADVLISSFGGDAAIFPDIRRRSAIIGTFTSFPETWGATLIGLTRRTGS
jgi:ribose transport system substrate-binding protein